MTAKLVMRIIGVVWIFCSFKVIFGVDTHLVGILQSQGTSWMNFVTNHTDITEENKLEFITIDDRLDKDSFDNLSNASKMLQRNNISALIGPFSEIFAFATEHNRVPYIVTSMVPYGIEKSPFLIQIVPNVSTYGFAVNDIVHFFNWRKVGLIYDNEEGPYVLSRLVDKDPADMKAYNIRDNNSENFIRDALKNLRDKATDKFIIMCSSANADIVLTQALYLSLLSRPNTWLIVNMGTDSVTLDKYLDSRANITSLLLMLDTKHTNHCALSSTYRKLHDAVLLDAIKVFRDIKLRHILRNSSRLKMRKTLREIELDGCTGKLKFSKFGIRNETFFQLATLPTLRNGSSGLFQSGTWRSGKRLLKDRIKPSDSYDVVMRASDDIFERKMLRVTTIIEPPFIQWRNETPVPEEDIPNNLEGFCISILNEMAKELKFTYNISVARKYGSYKGPVRGWTGMVRILLQDRADIALAPFQITPDRSGVVDFTKPYMTKGTSVVVKKPDRSVSPFQFLSPLSKYVWITIFVSFLVTSLVMFAVSRVNCDRQSNYIHNLRESFWYIWGTILRGNLTGSPQGVSSRIVSSVWWFFSLIVISIYTANLAAFLTITNAHIPIESASDLPNQNEYEYGTVDGSQTENFFKYTNISHYQKMYAFMKLTDGAIVRRTTDGFRKVNNEKYAFLWDSPVVRHETAKNCDIMEIGSPFDLKGYGIATQKNSPYTERLSWVILKLNDEGTLYRLEGKWWRRPNCPDPRSSAKSKAIEISVASGMFYVLSGGIVLAGIVFVIEYILSRTYCICPKRMKGQAPQDRDENNFQNHVASNSSNFLEKDTELRTVLSRTLSIGENSLPHRWETEPV